MKHELENMIRQALEVLVTSGDLTIETIPPIKIERCRDETHGDYACNIAMVLAKPTSQSPRKLAEVLVEKLPLSDTIEKIDIAGPGFINITLTDSEHHQVVATVLSQGKSYGLSTAGQGQRIHLEFVSTNPTGPLHVGHGRSAAIGSALANLLTAVGFDVHREYYVNDAGRQMAILATSVWLRYLEKLGEQLTFPKNGYQGDYVYDIAASLIESHGEQFKHSAGAVMTDLPSDEGELESDHGGDKEAHIDGIIERAQQLLGQQDYRIIFDRALSTICDDIRNDLENFRVSFDCWFSEKGLVDSGAIEHAIDTLKGKDLLFEKDGALWFKATTFGDDKDRVLVRDNGMMTYFASDIAYHLHKLEGGYDYVLDIFGADHHGYVPRVRAAMKALAGNDDTLGVVIVQFAILFRGKERVQMSTRSGSFITLRELYDEVGVDATRFFYVMRKAEQHLDFDMELAKSKTNENPVFYIQYAHARICSVFNQLGDKQITWDQSVGLSSLNQLKEAHELSLLKLLSRYPEVVEASALNYEPHTLAHFLKELATEFHVYYNAHQFIVSEQSLRDARLALIQAVKQVIANGLALLGITAPESM